MNAPVRVFLVEDQPQLLRQLAKVLASYPELEVVGSARDGEDALAQLAALQPAPQVVLLDLELPGLDGIQVTARLKGHAGAPEVLILTSFEDEQRVYEAMRAGASGYLVKRQGPERIREAIREVLDGGTVLEPRIARRFWNYFQSVQAAPPAGDPPNPWDLSETELEVLRYVTKGLSNAEVGRVMALERRTVRTHLSHIYRKLGVNSHVEAVVLALQAGVVAL
ncbi:response regulator transcription factor [Aggregicoccus sp. 17bor-14]|uniref:response regulator n=1 Tax=Myxococcaceae TaxID=31 RepID=UPI00129C7C4E|nr:MULTISPECIES: response regulator transcription factor [Myxococcaceae]MBF5040826.1 response regulator transcription factor [Simulacricoccus sp. 17bor-14]MRI86615.1 response regulator transcription factor [Aggregicoccus sp. 17bor-14]